jgi:hypothetical protein
MKYLLPLMLLISFGGSSIGDIDCPLGDVYYTISVPEDWNVVGMGCCGIAASDSANPARGIVALNIYIRASTCYRLIPLLRPIWKTTCRRISVWEIVL